MNPFLATREDIENQERETFAPYATFSQQSKGREYPEEDDPQRTCFQRDRDRVIHCRSYRRLKGKTQVFVSHHGDHFRNRLTHTMEVAQLSRDVSRNLRLNEDLAETIALSHDLGHTPFGHAGQEAMAEIMKEFDGTFEHNQQSRRIVEKLEKKSPYFQGLNLSWEVRDGLHKHRQIQGSENAISKNGSLEAQVVDMCDQIAYQNHDIDDGLRAGIFPLSELEKLDIWREISSRVSRSQPEKIWISQAISSLIKLMVSDMLTETIMRLEQLNPKTGDDIRHAPQLLVSLSPEMQKKNIALRHFLAEKFYGQPEVVRQSQRGKATIRRIFSDLMDHPEKLPGEYWHMISDGEQKEIVIKDFIAGMTDDFAMGF